MSDHAAPSGDKPQAQQTGVDKGAQDPDTPHPRNVKDEGGGGSAGALHQALQDNGNAVEGLGYGHHPKNGGPKLPDLRVSGEDTHQLGSEEEQHSAGDHHQTDFQGQECTGQAVEPLAVLGTQGVACQSGGGGLHAPAGDIEQGLHRIGNGVGGGRYVPQGIDHGGKGNIAQAGAKALEHIGEGYFQAGPQHLHIRLKPLAFGRDIRMLPQ